MGGNGHASYVSIFWTCMGMLGDIPPHRILVAAVDNIDTTNANVILASEQFRAQNSVRCTQYRQS